MTNSHEDSDPSSLLGEITLLTVKGRAALANGDGKRAFDILCRKHELLIEVFQEDSGPAGTSLIDLAEALHLMGNEKEARKAIDSALTIFKALDRRDSMRDRLERTLIDICKRQGHSYLVEELLQARTAAAGIASSEAELRRAAEQDELAMMLVRRQEYDKALPLLLDSKATFERGGPAAYSDLAVCCIFVARVYRLTEKYSESVAYGREAAQYAALASGETSLEAIMAQDELAVGLGLLARELNDPGRAQEAVALSDRSALRFSEKQGVRGKEAIRSQENNRRLKEMLAPLMQGAVAEGAAYAGEIALPTFCFISHAYSDHDSLSVLLALLPSYVQPVVFEPMTLPPHEFVSEKLISGVLDADGMIYIDSVLSAKSFWCSFERDLAARKKKHMFRFDPITREIERVQIAPRELKLAHCFHARDGNEVQYVMRWLIDQRAFSAFDDVETLGTLSSPPFATMQAEDRDLRLFSLRTFGTLYLIFLSDAVLGDDDLRRHVVDQILKHSRGTVLCWLSPRPNRLPDDLTQALAVFPEEHLVSFPCRPGHADFSVHLLDDLSVRLFWVHNRVRSGDWTL